ncbi:MAG: sensor histidine kinase, partial [Firmicutes bacterium]|nr:sensor histidine kinase [Bacillota bacterium]
DLLRSEQLNNETASEYVEIIAKHAAKLKKLTVDIVDASKASTGNVKVDISKLSVGMMLEQAVGEYREKLEKSHLVPVISIPDNDIEIMADGRHMGRVLDNVLSNICKYAQPETRVYMDVKEDGNKAVIVFKNISGAELNISADDLMERFVRGDASRNTEGSGLGLSIAKSLTQLQGGTFDIAIDGDLFKVVITMNMAMDMSGE